MLSFLRGSARVQVPVADATHGPAPRYIPAPEAHSLAAPRLIEMPDEGPEEHLAVVDVFAEDVGNGKTHVRSMVLTEAVAGALERVRAACGREAGSDVVEFPAKERAALPEDRARLPEMARQVRLDPRIAGPLCGTCVETCFEPCLGVLPRLLRLVWTRMLGARPATPPAARHTQVWWSSGSRIRAMWCTRSVPCFEASRRVQSQPCFGPRGRCSPCSRTPCLAFSRAAVSPD